MSVSRILSEPTRTRLLIKPFATEYPVDSNRPTALPSNTTSPSFARAAQPRDAAITTPIRRPFNEGLRADPWRVRFLKLSTSRPTNSHAGLSRDLHLTTDQMIGAIVPGLGVYALGANIAPTNTRTGAGTWERPGGVRFRLHKTV